MGIYEKSVEMCVYLRQSVIILKWPSAANRASKSNYLLTFTFPHSPSVWWSTVDTETKVPTVDNLELSKVPALGLE